MDRRLSSVAVGLGLLLAAQSTTALAQDLAALSLEDLLTSEVTSVAKRPQTVDTAPAAVFVIGKEDIRRSGGAGLTDLLRMVPGLEVADIAGDTTAVSARGFNGRYANKLLVLVDGRAVYLSTVSGVLWGQQLLPVEDIERIEVVRGPGASLWGANAVNGVINIISKHAVDTLGVSTRASVDSIGQNTIDLRLGAPLGPGAMRLYATTRAEGRGLSHARGRQLGFRYDQDALADAAFTLQGDLQRGRYREPQGLDGAPYAAGWYAGHNLLARWTWGAGARGYTVQAYWDRVERHELASFRRDQFDLDISRRQTLGGAHQLVWGAGYRLTRDAVAASPVVTFSPARRNDQWYGAYLQDDVTLAADRLVLTLGAKLEHNDFTGVEVQPTARLWMRVPRGSVWAAYSRATRTPSRFESDATPHFDAAPAAAPVSPALSAERLTAYEIGWRATLPLSVKLDVTAFHNRYRDLLGWQNQAGGVGPALRPSNGGVAVNAGLEAALEASPRPGWTLEAAATWQRPRDQNSAAGGLQLYDLSNSPKHQLSLRSLHDLSPTVDLDIWLRRVGATGHGAAPAYGDLDLALTWRAAPGFDVMVVGENLLEPRRIEMNGALFGAVGAPVYRTIGLKAAFRR